MKDPTVRMMGVLNIAMGLGGIGLILMTFYLTTTVHEFEFLLQISLQQYPVAFPTMLLCSLVLLVSLVASGILLFRRSERALRLVLWLYALEIGYLTVTALTPTGGVFAGGNIGLFPQVASAFPIWGFIVLWCASKQSMRLIRPRKRWADTSRK